MNPATDQYGGINAETLPNTGFGLFFVVVLGVIAVALGLYIVITSRRA